MVPGDKRQLRSPVISSQASVGPSPNGSTECSSGRSHIRIDPPLRRQWTEVSHMVGCHGCVVSVWNSSFRALGRVLLNMGWSEYFKLFMVWSLVAIFSGLFLQECCLEALWS